MALRLFNTLNRTTEEFRPVSDNRVTFYMCGPTVWSYAHIGNFRTFLLGDLLRRYLEYSGYDVFMIMNLTDVDDRLIEQSRKAGHSIREHTEQFVRAFFEDRDYLRIRPADVYPRATEYVKPMVELVNQLIDRGIAYTAEDGSVYYAVDRFHSYGRLSQVEKRELKSGARVASDEYAKEDVRDFALWKSASDVDEQVSAAWDAPFGRGRPGWHLECSAMALSELKQFGIETLDIHAGGVDLVFPHHENEIAQSEGATGKQFARYWLHGEFLLVEGTKMSKRFGNYLTARDLAAEGIDAAAVRMLMFSTHYRQQLNFSDQGLESASEGVRRVGDFRERLAGVAGGAAPKGNNVAGDPGLQLDEEFRAAMDDDLNAPRAVGAVFQFIRTVNAELDGGLEPGNAAARLAAFDRVMEVLDLVPARTEVDQELASWVEERVAARQEARKTRDFQAADAIRDELLARGVELEDTPEGPRWKLRRG